MLIKIIAVGKIKDRGLQSKIDEFTKWISRHAKLEIIELRDSNIEKEGTVFLKNLGKDKAFVFALSEEGKEFTSNKFSQKLACIDQKLVFIIGGYLRR